MVTLVLGLLDDVKCVAKEFVLDDRARVYMRVLGERAGGELYAAILDVDRAIFVFAYVDASATCLVRLQAS